MPSTITDRLNGLTTSTAVKSPVRVATTANITLSGLQTIDGVTVAALDRVLVKDQTDAAENGIWVAASGAWSRASDFNGSFDAVGGTLVIVTSGTANANSFWQIDGYGELVIGTDDITFEATSGNISLQADLASTASASVGAGMVGFDDANSYAAGTAGYELRKLNTRNLGTIAGGGNTVTGIDIDTTVTANADGLSDFRGIVNKTVVAGANSMAEVDGFTGQLEIQTTGGTLTHGFAIKAYSRLGNAALGIAETGTITAFDVINGHIANEGNDAIGTAIVFRADSLDLIDGTGTITDAYGVGIGNFGHATRVTGNAVGVAVNDMTAGASKTIAFWSQMVDGTNKWSFYANSSAPSALGGRLAVGSTTRPTDTLDIDGHIKAIRGASAKLATGSYHELRSDQNTWSTVVSNAHASTPNGLRIFFDGSSPNNTTQMFIECRDATEQKLMVWSNGNVVNKNNSYGAISDKKFKTGIRDATPQLDDIKAVRFRKYKLKSDGKNAPEHLGVIAQEIEKVSPGLVSVDGNGTKSVNYSILYLKAVKALQELAAIVEAQDKRIKAMESRP